MSSKTYLGYHAGRLRRSALERRFHKQWKRHNEYSIATTKQSLLEGILKDPTTDRVDVGQREWSAVNTVIQWLGSEVGVEFIVDILCSAEGATILGNPRLRDRLTHLMKNQLKLE